MTQQTTPLPDHTEDDLHRCLLCAGPEERAAFLEKFGRNPSEDDPWHFDPDADEARPNNCDAVRQGPGPICWFLAELARCASDELDETIFEASLYASRKTGLVPDQYSYLRISQEGRNAFGRRLREYFDSLPNGIDMSLGRFH